MLSSPDITQRPLYSFAIFSVFLYELILFLMNFHFYFEVGRFSKNSLV